VLRQSSGKDLAAMSEVVSGEESVNVQSLATSYQSQRLTLSGQTAVSDVRVISSDIEPGSGKAPQVRIDSCEDVSSTTVVDAAGKKIARPDPSPFRRWNTIVKFYPAAGPDRWFVVSRQWRAVPSC
jgi:hypothetical protein